MAVGLQDMENAVPKVILKMMNVDGITRENVASHLQKYRLHLRHQSGLQASKVDSKRAFQLEEAPQHHNVDLKSAPAIMTQGLPIPHSTPVPQSSTAGRFLQTNSTARIETTCRGLYLRQCQSLVQDQMPMVLILLGQNGKIIAICSLPHGLPHGSPFKPHLIPQNQHQ